MLRSLQIVVITLLTAVIGLGNCAMCLGLSAATEAGQHACCKPQKVQPPCHTNSEAPGPDQDDCSGRIDMLKGDQAAEKMPSAPVPAATPVIDLLKTAASAHGGHLSPNQVTASFSRPPQSPTPLRI